MSAAADLFRAGLDCLSSGDIDGYLDTFSDDIVFEFPFAPAGRPEVVIGRAALAEYLAPLFGRVSTAKVASLIVYETDVEATIVAEMTMESVSPSTGDVTSRQYVAVVKEVDGKIAAYRDYWKPRSS